MSPTDSTTARAAALEQSIRRDPLWIVAQFVLFAKILVFMLAMDPYADDTFVLPKSAIGHSISLVLAALIAALALRHGPGVFRWTWIHLAAASVLLSFAVATPFALDQTVALFGASRRFLGLTQVADDLLVYAAAAVLIRTLADIGRLMAAIGAGLVPMLGYGFIQHAGLDPIKYENETLRPISTLGQPDVLAGFLSVCVATVGTILVVLWRSLRRPARAGLGLLLVGCVAVMLFTEVRNIVLGLTAGVVAFGAVGLLYEPWRSRIHRTPLAIGASVSAVFIIAFVLLSPAGARLRPDRLASDPAVEARLDGWRAAIRLVADRPLLGLGPDNFVVAYPTVRSELSVIATSNEALNSTHNWLLHTLVGAGFAGAVSTLVFLAVVAVAGLRLAQRGSAVAFALVPVAAYLGQGLVDVNDIGLGWIPWLCGGVIAAAVGVPIPRPNRWPKVSVASELLAAGVMLGLAVALAAPTLGRIRASEVAKASAAYANSKDSALAVQLAREAIMLDGRRGEYWSVFGSSLAAGGNSSAAYTAFIDGTQRAPWMALLWRNAALAKVRLGDPAGALVAAKRALADDRLDVEALNIVARLSYNADDYHAALDAGLTALRLHPDDPSLYVVPALAYSSLGDAGNAERILRQGIAAGGSVDLHVLLAQLLAKSGRTPEAIQELDIALALDPGNAAIGALRQQLLAR